MNFTWTQAALIVMRAARSLPRVFAIMAASPACTSNRRIQASSIARLWALVACPTASIIPCPTAMPDRASRHFRCTSWTMSYFCGFTSEAFLGAWAYLIVRPPDQGGNVLVDSPRFTMPLVKRIEQMGGVNLMFRFCIATISLITISLPRTSSVPGIMHDGEHPSAARH